MYLLIWSITSPHRGAAEAKLVALIVLETTIEVIELLVTERPVLVLGVYVLLVALRAELVDDSVDDILEEELVEDTLLSVLKVELVNDSAEDILEEERTDDKLVATLKVKLVDEPVEYTLEEELVLLMVEVESVEDAVDEGIKDSEDGFADVTVDDSVEDAVDDPVLKVSELIELTNEVSELLIVELSVLVAELDMKLEEELTGQSLLTMTATFLSAGLLQYIEGPESYGALKYKHILLIGAYVANVHVDLERQRALHWLVLSLEKSKSYADGPPT